MDSWDHRTDVGRASGHRHRPDVGNGYQRAVSIFRTANDIKFINVLLFFPVSTTPFCAPIVGRPRPQRRFSDFFSPVPPHAPQYSGADRRP